MNIYAFVLVVFILLWVMGVFFGFLTGVSKTFKSEPNQSSSQAEKIRAKEHQFAEDARMKRQKLMEDIQQKMRDNQKKF